MSPGPDREFRNRIPTSATATPGAHTHAATDVTSAVLSTARLGSGTPGAGKYVDGAAGVWTTLPAAGATNLDGLSDVAVSGATTAHILRHNGTQFVNVDGGTLYAPLSHTHSGADITSGTVAPARLGSGSGGASKFLREDSSWQTISSGPTGPAPGVPFAYDTSTTASDPGSGKFRVSGLGTSVYISETDALGGSMLGLFPTLSGSNIVFETSAGDFLLYNVTAAVDNGAWWTLTVASLGQGGSFSNGESAALLSAPRGATGATGPAGPGGGDVVGPSSAVNNNLAAFDTTTGKLIKDAGIAISAVATLTGSQTLTNKTLTAPVIASISNTGTLTLPTSTDTLVGRATTDTLTNKTLTSPTLVTPALGTPASGNLANCTFPTLNQNTTGSAAKLTTARTINGTSFDGTANITFDYRPGGTDVAVADGGTGASTAAAARTNLGVAFGGCLPGIPYTFDGSSASPGAPASGHCVFDTSGWILRVHATDSLGNNWTDMYAWGASQFFVQMVDASGHIAGGLGLGFSPIGGVWDLQFDTDPTTMLSTFTTSQPIYLRV